MLKIIISGIVIIEIIVLIATVSEAKTLSSSYFEANKEVTVATGHAAHIRTVFAIVGSILSKAIVKIDKNGINNSLKKQTIYRSMFLMALNTSTLTRNEPRINIASGVFKLARKLTVDERTPGSVILQKNKTSPTATPITPGLTKILLNDKKVFTSSVHIYTPKVQ